MVTLFVVLLVALVFSIWKFGKKRVKSTINGAVKDVKSVLSPLPIDQLKSQLKKAKVSCAELSTSTEKLRLDLYKEQQRSSDALEAAQKAKAAGCKADAEECFNIHLNAEEGISVLSSDIDANDALYNKVIAEMSKKEIQVSKFESAQARADMRTASNAFRRNIARDVVLGEGVALDVEEVCEEELEAVAYEKMAGDLGKDRSVVDKYNDGASDDKFEAFYGEE